MAPKKKRRDDRRRPPTTASVQGVATLRQPRRTPVARERPPRWPLAVWTPLGLAWAVGSPLFLLFYLAEGFAALAAPETVDVAATRGYLLGLLLCGVGAPLVGATTALWLGRRVAAGMFALLLALSTALVWWLAGNPANLLGALRP